ncbi:hypothetical protein [uncultured Anaerococcus sp.]|uniref:hypothetical protein n=1 Tax=uncultured Anaerococcus sp. TaxID=293428 RepID=UPI00288AB66A|nr:hypothetical protein [uncultured Anaerococcus sp.]
MVEEIYKKGKKYLIIDGKEFGPKSLYFHIKRALSYLKKSSEEGKWDENMKKEAKDKIRRLIKIYRENYPEDDLWG